MISLLALAPLAAPARSAAEEPAAEFSIGREDFFEPGLAPVRQSGPYDVTVVYFMDYQCPACRKYTPDVARALKEERRVRVIYRDTPIFGPRSEAAARAAIASQFQGRHEAIHHALMTTKGQIDEAALRAAADKAGVDWARLQRDLEARGDEIDQLIAWNLELSSAAGISGTPAFVIGDKLADGALDYRGLKAEIADARAAIPKPPIEAASDEKSDEPGAKAAAGPKSDAAAATSAPAEPANTAPAFQESQASTEAAMTPAPSARSAVWPWIAGLLAALIAIFWVARSRSS